MKRSIILVIILLNIPIPTPIGMIGVSSICVCEPSYIQLPTTTALTIIPTTNYHHPQSPGTITFRTEQTTTEMFPLLLLMSSTQSLSLFIIYRKCHKNKNKGLHFSKICQNEDLFMDQNGSNI
jgi:hypothetical protein